MSSDSDEEHDHQRCRPKKRYKQFQSAASVSNLHPRTLKRWESKIDSSLNAELSQVTSRDSETDDEITRNIPHIEHDGFTEHTPENTRNKIHKLNTESRFEASHDVPSSSSMFEEEKMEDHIEISDAVNITRNLLFVNENSLSCDDSSSLTTDGNDELSDSSNSTNDDNENFVSQQLENITQEPQTEDVHADDTQEDDTELPKVESDEILSFNVSKMKEYLLDDSSIMFPESGLKISEVILMIFGFSVRFSLSYKGRRELINLVKVLAGPKFENWSISDYYLSSIFDPPDDIIQYHFYCAVCCLPLEAPTSKKKFKNHNKICVKCLVDYKLSMNSPDYFISIDITYQLRTLLNVDLLKTSLFENIEKLMSKSRTELNISDVHDGQLYQKLVSSPKSTGIITLTCTLNTDGAALFHSSKRSFWPILCFISEFPPHLRFKYVILAGLWIGTKEPTPEVMNLYLQPFVEQLKLLSSTGFVWISKEGKSVRFLLKPLICNVDSVARPILQNRVQYNGHYGCSWCYSFGDYVGGSMRFLLKEDDPEIRTHESHITDMNAAIKIVQAQEASGIKKKKFINGVKGYSVLSDLQLVRVGTSIIECRFGRLSLAFISFATAATLSFECISDALLYAYSRVLIFDSLSTALAYVSVEKL